MSPARKKTKAAKPAARKASARKKTTRKAASKPSRSKADKPKAAKTAKPKATKPKTTKPKKAKTIKASAAPLAAATATAPAAAPARKKAAPSKRASSRRRKAKPVGAPVADVLPQRTPVAGEPRFKLGSKWECFSCGAKFYDLNKPEPLCPKCGANQLERPKAGPQVKPPQPPGASRAMAPLLDEDEDAMLVSKEELDLGMADVDEAVNDFIDEGEADEDSIEEEDEEP